jgi:ribosomal protein L10
MAKTKQQKSTELSAMRELLSMQKSMYFVDYKGLKNEDLLKIKKELKTKDGKLVAVKKSLTNVLFKEKGIEFNPKDLEGQVAIAFGFKDQFSPTKPLVEFSKQNKNLKILGGCYMDEGKYHFINTAEVVAFSTIPSREELYAMLAFALNDTAASFARVVNAVKEQKEKQAA